MGTVGRLRAGAGKAFADLGRGVAQLAGGMSRSDVDEIKQRDAALMDTGAGLAGNIIGNVAAAVPTVAIPGAATLRGAIRAALRHLLEGTAQNALVHNEDAVVVARLIRDGSVIRIVGVI
jgi:tRNA G46 methylase TrmB